MSNVQGIRLGQDFGVTDEHLGTIVEHFGPQLQSLELGNSDNGVQASSSRLPMLLTSGTPAMQPRAWGNSSCDSSSHSVTA